MCVAPQPVAQGLSPLHPNLENRAMEKEPLVKAMVSMSCVKLEACAEIINEELSISIALQGTLVPLHGNRQRAEKCT